MRDTVFETTTMSGLKARIMLTRRVNELYTTAQLVHEKIVTTPMHVNAVGDRTNQFLVSQCVE